MIKIWLDGDRLSLEILIGQKVKWLAASQILTDWAEIFFGNTYGQANDFKTVLRMIFKVCALLKKYWKITTFFNSVQTDWKQLRGVIYGLKGL